VKQADQVVQALKERKLPVEQRSAILEVVRASHLVDDADAKFDEYFARVMRCNGLFAQLGADEREGVEVAFEYQREQLYQYIRQLRDDLNAVCLALLRAI
jgi:hypothetical protein